MQHVTVQLPVYFALSKGEGEFPRVADLTESETQDLRSICKFYLHLDNCGDSAPSANIIKECTVYYDGILPIPGFLPGEEGYGLSIKQGRIVGRIRPLVSFYLTEPVDPENFKRLVWCSWYEVHAEQSDKTFYAEDWNGYTEILSSYRAGEWKLHLQKHNAFSGKTFSVEGLSQGSCALEL